MMENNINIFDILLIQGQKAVVLQDDQVPDKTLAP